MNIAKDLFVSIDYNLTIDDGVEIDKSAEGEPLGFIIGSGQIIPGLEDALIGKEVGYADTIVVTPEDAYGEVNDELFQEVPKEQFPSDMEIEPGMNFEAQGPQGPFMITIKEVNDNDTITVDLNHPMAGKVLTFDVKVVEVREPTAEETANLTASQESGCGCGCGSEAEGECGPNKDEANCNSSGCSCS